MGWNASSWHASNWFGGDWYQGPDDSPPAPALHPRWSYNRLGLGLGILYRPLQWST